MLIKCWTCLRRIRRHWANFCYGCRRHQCAECSLAKIGRVLFAQDRSRMNVLTMSRKEVEVWRPARPRLAEVISITDPGAGPAALCPGITNVLRLAFSDVDRSWPDLPEIVPYSRAQADAVAEFVWALPPIDLLVVHCEAGISRSVGMANAIALAFGARRSGPIGIPNSFVFSRTSDALMVREAVAWVDSAI